MFQKPYVSHPPRKIDFSDEEVLTEQHHRDACSISTILNQYDKTGLITHVNKATAAYGDYTEVNEYQESLNMVIRAQNAFGELPAHIRKRFDNDPGEFFEFATNPANLDEMVELGLAQRMEEAAPMKVEVINQQLAPENEGA
nr:MAG: internal scaffolding protein [Microvirus sp.]